MESREGSSSRHPTKRCHARLAAWVVMVGSSLVAFAVPDSAVGKNEVAPEVAVSDLHNSVLSRLFTTGNKAGLRDVSFPVSLAGMQTVHTKFVFLSIGIPQFNMRERKNNTIEDVLSFLNHQRKTEMESGGALQFAGNRQQLDEAMLSKRIAYAFALEGTHLLDGDVTNIDRLHSAGVRMITITHWFQNEFVQAPSSPDRAPQPGPALLTDDCILTEKGRALVSRMIEKRILIDVSHLGLAAFKEVVILNAKRTPLIASHSNAKALCGVARNLDDSQIQAIADSNGLIGICLHEPLLVAAGVRASVVDVANHIDHIKKIAGLDHVSIGTDFEGGITTPEKLHRFEDLSRLRSELLKRGYLPADIEKIMWSNVLRIVPAV